MQEGGKKEEQSEKGEEKDLRRKKGEGGVGSGIVLSPNVKGSLVLFSMMVVFKIQLSYKTLNSL